MSKIITHITNANGRLDKFLLQIKEAVVLSESYALPILKTKYDIDVVFSDTFHNSISEIHIGGYTYADDFIAINIDSNALIRTTDLFQIICHELCHAARWQYNDEWSTKLIDNMLSEGIATAFEEETATDNNMEPEFFLKTMIERSDEENKKILHILRGQLDKKDYDYNKVFIVGDKKLGLPRWSGYSLGYHLVKKYMAKTSKKVSEIYDSKYSNMCDMVKL